MSFDDFCKKYAEAVSSPGQEGYREFARSMRETVIVANTYDQVVGLLASLVDKTQFDNVVDFHGATQVVHNALEQSVANMNTALGAVANESGELALEPGQIRVEDLLKSHDIAAPLKEISLISNAGTLADIVFGANSKSEASDLTVEKSLPTLDASLRKRIYYDRPFTVEDIFRTMFTSGNVKNVQSEEVEYEVRLSDIPVAVPDIDKMVSSNDLEATTATRLDTIAIMGYLSEINLPEINRSKMGPVSKELRDKRGQLELFPEPTRPVHPSLKR